MKILVISDTHIKDANINDIKQISLPRQLLEDLKSADLILHAGDLVELNIFEMLNKLKPTYIVSGNMDSKAVSERLPKKQVIQLDRFKIGLIHGQGPPR